MLTIKRREATVATCLRSELEQGVVLGNPSMECPFGYKDKSKCEVLRTGSGKCIGCITEGSKQRLVIIDGPHVQPVHVEFSLDGDNIWLMPHDTVFLNGTECNDMCELKGPTHKLIIGTVNLELEIK